MEADERRKKILERHESLEKECGVTCLDLALLETLIKLPRYQFDCRVQMTEGLPILAVMDLLQKKKVILAHRKWVSLLRGYYFLPMLSDPAGRAITTADLQKYKDILLVHGVTLGRRTVNLQTGQRSVTCTGRGGASRNHGHGNRELHIKWKHFPLKALVQEFDDIVTANEYLASEYVENDIARTKTLPAPSDEYKVGGVRKRATPKKLQDDESNSPATPSKKKLRMSATRKLDALHDEQDEEELTLPMPDDSQQLTEEERLLNEDNQNGNKNKKEESTHNNLLPHESDEDCGYNGERHEVNEKTAENGGDNVDGKVDVDDGESQNAIFLDQTTPTGPHPSLRPNASLFDDDTRTGRATYLERRDEQRWAQVTKELAEIRKGMAVITEFIATLPAIAQPTMMPAASPSSFSQMSESSSVSRSLGALTPYTDEARKSAKEILQQFEVFPLTTKGDVEQFDARINRDNVSSYDHALREKFVYAINLVNPARDGGEKALYTLWRALIKYPRTNDEAVQAGGLQEFDIDWLRNLQIFTIVSDAVLTWGAEYLPMVRPNNTNKRNTEKIEARWKSYTHEQRVTAVTKSWLKAQKQALSRNRTSLGLHVPQKRLPKKVYSDDDEYDELDKRDANKNTSRPRLPETQPSAGAPSTTTPTTYIVEVIDPQTNSATVHTISAATDTIEKGGNNGEHVEGADDELLMGKLNSLQYQSTSSNE